MLLRYISFIVGCLCVASLGLAIASTPADNSADGLTAGWRHDIASQAISPVVPAPGDLVRSWRGPDGRTITAVVQIPHPAAGAPVVTMAAVPDGADARPAFEAAATRARQIHAGKLIIPPGRYLFPSEDSPGQIHVLLSDLSDLTIEGQNATFVFAGTDSGLGLANMTRVMLRDLNVEYAVPIYSLGTVIKGSPNNLLKIDPGDTLGPDGGIGHINEFDRTCACFAWHALPARAYFPPGMPQPQNLGGNTYSSAAFLNNAVGKSFLVFHHWYTGATIKIAGGSDIVMDNVTLRSEPGQGFAARHVVRGLAIIHSRVEPPPGRLISSEYDAMPITAGGDVIIDGNRFRGIGDDLINITASVHHVLAVAADQRSATLDTDTTFIRPGHLMYFFGPQNEVLARARVVSLSAVKGGNIVQFDGALTNVDTHSVAKDVALANGRIYIGNNNGVLGGSILVQNPNALIENNVINAPITIGEMRGTFNEGIGAINVAVRGNTLRFIAPYGGRGDLPWAAINVFGRLGVHMSVSPVNFDVEISGNHILSSAVGCVSVASAERVTVSHNSCTDTNQGAGLSPGEKPSINVIKSDHVIISGNIRNGATTGKGDADPATTHDINLSDS